MKNNNYKSKKDQTMKADKDFSKRDRKKNFKSRKEAEIPATNDWEFYAASDQIAKDVASIPFNYLGGTNFNLPTKSYFDGSTKQNNTFGAIPSVITMNYFNSIGVTDTNTKAINMAAVQMYTYVRHQNSGAKVYEAADLMMYVLAMRDIYASFFEIKRIYGCAALYNYYNHNLPDTILKGMLIDPNDLRSNLAQYRAQINLMARKINSFAVPKYFKAFARTAFVNSYIFTDSNSVKGQMYQFRRLGYYTWSGTASETGTTLVYNDYENESIVTLQNKIDVLNSQLDALFLDQDALTMSGDILKAYGDSDLYVVSETEDGYVTGITYDENVLSQIENCTCVLPDINLDTDGAQKVLNIFQSNQVISFNPTIIYNDYQNGSDMGYAEYGARVLNSHKDNPDYKDVLEWTRLMCTCKFTNVGNLLTQQFSSTGLEVIFYYTVSRINSNGEVINVKGNNSMVRGGSSDSDNLLADIELLSLLSEFDWHPIVYIHTTGGILVPFGDLKVSTSIDSSTIDGINDAAVYGAFYADKFYGNK